MQPLNIDLNRDRASILATLPKPNIPLKVKEVAQASNMAEKTEYHVSILASDNSRVIKALLEQTDSSDELFKNIEELINGTSWGYTLLDDYYLLEKEYTRELLIKNGYKDWPGHKRTSLVQKVEMPSLSQFYGRLTELTGTHFTVPVPHITLFAWSEYEPLMTLGIGVSSREEFDRYTIKVIEV